MVKRKQRGHSVETTVWRQRQNGFVFKLQRSFNDRSPPLAVNSSADFRIHATFIVCVYALLWYTQLLCVSFSFFLVLFRGIKSHLLCQEEQYGDEALLLSVESVPNRSIKFLLLVPFSLFIKFIFVFRDFLFYLFQVSRSLSLSLPHVNSHPETRLPLSPSSASNVMKLDRRSIPVTVKCYRSAADFSSQVSCYLKKYIIQVQRETHSFA